MGSEATELSKEAGENDAPGGRIVEHYRVDPSRFLVPLLAIAGTIMVLGALGAGTAIGAAPPPRIVVAHSLGSVVGWEALAAYPQIEVDLFVTVGSPLALPRVVWDRLEPAPRDGFGQRPAGVQRWVNLADRGDLIAIPRGGVKDRFRGVEDDCETSIHWADFHLVSNYLKTEALAEILRPLLR